MFIVFLRYTDKHDQSERWMQAHRDWLQSGFDDGVFLFVGRLAAQAEGAILAHGLAHGALQERVERDPFVKEGVVRAEIIELSPVKADERLSFLLG